MLEPSKHAEQSCVLEVHAIFNRDGHNNQVRSSQILVQSGKKVTILCDCCSRVRWSLNKFDTCLKFVTVK